MISLSNYTESKSTITAIVKDGNKILGVHKYNKVHSQHSFTEDKNKEFEDNEILEIFAVSRELVDAERLRHATNN